MNMKYLLVTLAALAVAGGAILFLTRPPTPVANESEPAKSTATVPPPVAAAPTVAKASAAKPTAPAAKPLPSALPMVNGVQITGKDLMPGGGEEAPPGATQEMLDRAIERQLIMQAASEAGVSLSEDQKHVLEDVATNIANRPEYRGGNDPARMQAEIDFQVRETTAQLYLSALAAQPAATDALPSGGQATHSYLDGLRANAKIEPGK